MRECEKEERARGRKIKREREIIREAISERDRKEDNSTYKAKARQHSIPIKVQNR